MRRHLVLGLLLFLLACGGGGEGAAAPSAWRSALFPEDWTPDFEDAQGRHLPDVSYAGYQGGEAPRPDLSGVPAVDVVADHGADPTGATDATAAFQDALDAAAPLVVHVPEGLYRIDGLLTATRSGVVLVGEGPSRSRLHFTRHDGMTGRDHLSFRGTLALGTDIPLAADGAARAFHVVVEDATGLAVGDDVVLGWTITDAFVAEHGMTGTWQAFHGTWQVFLRREVVAIDTSLTPRRVQLDAPLRTPARVRDGASLRVATGHLEAVGVRDLGLANAVAWDDAWANERVHALGFDGVKDAWVENVDSFPSPSAPASGAGAGAHLQNGGLFVKRSKRVTIASCRMERAQHRGGGGCGYLFEIMQSCEVLTRDCVGKAGRHNFIQNWGFGTTGCVWLRCHSADGLAVATPLLPSLGTVGLSEYHHSIATACLVDSCRIDDGWGGVNRGGWSSGAGHSATQCVFWNLSGDGVIRSLQFGWGYVIGTQEGLDVDTALQGSLAAGTAPEDWREGIGNGAAVTPGSLYREQFRRRVGRDPETSP